MTLLALLAALLSPIADRLATAQAGIGTVFDHPSRDRHNPVAWAACLRRDIRDKDHIVAHRTLPCRARVWVYNPRTGRSTVAIVGDRGPRRAMIDLAPSVAKALRHNGRERVIVVLLGKH